MVAPAAASRQLATVVFVANASVAVSIVFWFGRLLHCSLPSWRVNVWQHDWSRTKDVVKSK